MGRKEPTILRAYTTLCLSKSVTLQKKKKNQILTSLESASLPANEDIAVAMMHYLNADTEGSISYSHFRNFMLLLPSERLEDDPQYGGLACALSTSVTHPIDTIKIRVQASTLSFPELVSKLPQIGLQGFYRGSIPAILGQFSSHGLRTGIFEASKLVLINVAPTLQDIQVQLHSLSSFAAQSWEQLLQAGIFDSVGEAIVGTMHQDGPKIFFQGTGAMLCWDVPFCVAGMGLYAKAKKVVLKAAQNLLNRDLEPWEIMVGAHVWCACCCHYNSFRCVECQDVDCSAGPASFDANGGLLLWFLQGGAVPKFFWIAPLGAMNCAGYELAK